MVTFEPTYTLSPMSLEWKTVAQLIWRYAVTLKRSDHMGLGVLKRSGQRVCLYICTLLQPGYRPKYQVRYILASHIFYMLVNTKRMACTVHTSLLCTYRIPVFLLPPPLHFPCMYVPVYLTLWLC